MKTIAICSSGVKPIPAVLGGAVECLTTVLLEQNEKYNEFQIDVYSVYEKELCKFKYCNTKIIQIRNWQKFFPVRASFSLLNRVLRLFHINKRYDFMSLVIPLRMKNKYDAIIVENNVSIYFLLRHRFPEKKILLHLHNDYDTIEYDFDKTEKRIRVAGMSADAILACSTYLKEHIQNLDIKKNCYLLENCINKELFRRDNRLVIEQSRSLKEKFSIVDDEFVILFCGRFSEEKGLLQLLQAVEKINIQFKLLIVGDTWFKTRSENIYATQINLYLEKLGNKIINLGYVDTNQMPSVYLCSPITVVPTQCVEAFGMTALESIAMGIPCIASKCGGLIDIVSPDCGLLINLGKSYVNDLRNSIIKIHDDHALYEKFKYNCSLKITKFQNEAEYFFSFLKIMQDIFCE